MKKKKEMIKGLAFDLDGTLIDTEVLFRKFWPMAAHQLGFPMEERHSLMLRSLPADRAIPLLQKEVCPEFDYYAVRARRRELMEAYLDEKGIPEKPEMRKTLEDLHLAGYKIALATATPLERAEKYLRRMEVKPFFDAIVCAEMVSRGKPDPDIYLEAAKRLSLEPGQVMSVEDSPTGVLAGFRAGCVTVMIPDQDMPDENTRNITDFLLPDLSSLRNLLLEA